MCENILQKSYYYNCSECDLNLCDNCQYKKKFGEIC